MNVDITIRELLNKVAKLEDDVSILMYKHKETERIEKMEDELKEIERKENLNPKIQYDKRLEYLFNVFPSFPHFEELQNTLLKYNIKIEYHKDIAYCECYDFEKEKAIKYEKNSYTLGTPILIVKEEKDIDKLCVGISKVIPYINGDIINNINRKFFYVNSKDKFIVIQLNRETNIIKEIETTYRIEHFESLKEALQFIIKKEKKDA